MAQSGHWADRVGMTAFDPKRTLVPVQFDLGLQNLPDAQQFPHDDARRIEG